DGTQVSIGGAQQAHDEVGRHIDPGAAAYRVSTLGAGGVRAGVGLAGRHVEFSACFLIGKGGKPSLAPRTAEGPRVTGPARPGPARWRPPAAAEAAAADGSAPPAATRTSGPAGWRWTAA